MSFNFEQLAGNPDFVLSLRFLAQALRQKFDGGPRLSRLLASHQRWLMTQIAFALHLEHDPQDPGSGLTTGVLRDVITAHKVASRNTVLSFLEELRTYRFLLLAPGEEARRPRRFVPAEASQNGMLGWCYANLAALDLLDSGNRAATFAADPRLFRYLQPRIAMNCLADPRWREPPAAVGMFLWTEAGGLVVDHLIANLDCRSAKDDRIQIGRVDTRSLAAQFMMSRTHLQRLLAKAALQGCIGWDDPVKKTQLWMSQQFLQEYCRWQAVKFAYVDEAFEFAQRKLAESTT